MKRRGGFEVLAVFLGGYKNGKIYETIYADFCISNVFRIYTWIYYSIRLGSWIVIL